MNNYLNSKSLIDRSDNYETRRDILSWFFYLSFILLIFIYHPNKLYQYLSISFFISVIILQLYNRLFLKPYLSIRQYYGIKRNLVLCRNDIIRESLRISIDIIKLIQKYNRYENDINELNIVENKVELRENGRFVL
jgi:hypothetical protein